MLPDKESCSFDRINHRGHRIVVGNRDSCGSDAGNLEAASWII